MLFALGLGGILAVFLMEALRTDSPTIPSGPTVAVNATNATNATMAISTEPVPHELPVAEPVREPVQEYLIKNGDTLSAIFDEHQISQTTLHQVMEADEQILALDIIRPGNKLTFSFNEDWSLEQMELYVHPARQILYRRVDADNFEFEERIHPGTWVQETISGDIRGSFFLSAQRAGLSETEVANITDLLKTRLNFRREMRLGDTFQVVRTQQFVGDEFTGESQILGVRIVCKRHSYDAFLFSDPGLHPVSVQGQSTPDFPLQPQTPPSRDRTSLPASRRGLRHAYRHVHLRSRRRRGRSDQEASLRGKIH